MKKLITSIVALSTVLFSGCKDLPSAETIGTLSKAIGYAAGVTCNLAKMPDKAKAKVTEVLDIVSEIVPAKEQSFSEAWAPVVKEYVDKAVSEKKIDESEGELITFAIGIAAKGMDYMFDKRWPKARDYSDLVSAATKGFVEGFKSVTKVSASKGEFPYDKAEYDKAIGYLTEK